MKDLSRLSLRELAAFVCDHLSVRGIETVLTGSDSVRDRLAAFYFWDDLQALEQALMVARDNEINLSMIEAWSEKEGALGKFEIFKKKLKDWKSKNRRQSE